MTFRSRNFLYAYSEYRVLLDSDLQIRTALFIFGISFCEQRNIFLLQITYCNLKKLYTFASFCIVLLQIRRSWKERMVYRAVVADVINTLTFWKTPL